MRYHWKHISGLASDFPERFLLEQKKDRIQVDVNRNLGRVQITCKDNKNTTCQSVISNGVVLREKEIEKNTNNPLDHLSIEEQIRRHSVALSSLPDENILKLIGGNYNVLVNFLGTVQSRRRIKKFFSVWGDGSWQDLRDIFLERLQTWKASLGQLFRWPSVSDLADFLFSLAVGFLTYQINFSFLLCGISMASASLLTGYIDWLLRHKQPYLLKVVFLFFPALYVSYRGFLLQ